MGVNGSSVVQSMQRFYLLSLLGCSAWINPADHLKLKQGGNAPPPSSRRCCGTDRAPGPSAWDYAAAAVLRVRRVCCAECVECDWCGGVRICLGRGVAFSAVKSA